MMTSSSTRTISKDTVMGAEPAVLTRLWRVIFTSGANLIKIVREYNGREKHLQTKSICLGSCGSSRARSHAQCGWVGAVMSCEWNPLFYCKEKR